MSVRKIIIKRCSFCPYCRQSHCWGCNPQEHQLKCEATLVSIGDCECGYRIIGEWNTMKEFEDGVVDLPIPSWCPLDDEEIEDKKITFSKEKDMEVYLL